MLHTEERIEPDSLAETRDWSEATLLVKGG